MADELPTLLVPGTQATSLRDKDGTVYNAVRVQLFIGKEDVGNRTPDQVGDLLSMEHVPGRLSPTKTTLEADNFVARGSVLRVPYDGLPVDIWWRYDWRADLRWNAKKLLTTLREESHGGQRWNLIGHSQGGLIILLASKLADSPREFASMVGRVALVGAPIAGTVRALEAILFGREDLGADRLEGLLAAARTWPALYQMLPSWAAALDNNGDERPPDKQFTVPGGWGALMNGKHPIQEDLLARARETQALLTGPFSHLGSVDTLTVMGKHQKTPINVRLKGSVYEKKYGNQKGDSLVPEKITQRHLGDPVHDRRLILTKPVKAHAMLCIDPDVQSTIGTFFEQPLLPLPAA